MEKIVIVDIDGTVAKVGDRLKYLKHAKPDYDKFYASCFNDAPIQVIIDLVNNLSENYKIVFCTGRREQVREITEKWLISNGLINYSLLLMRPNGDKRHDTEVKPEQLKLAGIKLERIAFVLEDRNSMVKKWRKLGVKCLQVEYGEF